ncbi:Uncharacterized protein FKW44_000461, partial [Caligus rogercresseyi]
MDESFALQRVLYFFSTCACADHHLFLQQLIPFGSIRGLFSTISPFGSVWMVFEISFFFISLSLFQSPIMAISKGPESRVTITSFAMQPPSQPPSGCNSILFAAYRTSSKLRLLQEALKLNVVKLRIVSHVLGHHGLGPSEKDSFLSWSQATGVLRDVYSAGSKIRSYYSPSLN